MIDRGLGACQIELRTGRKGPAGRGPAKKPQKKDAPQLPRQEEITENIQGLSQPPPEPPGRRYEAAEACRRQRSACIEQT